MTPPNAISPRVQRRPSCCTKIWRIAWPSRARVGMSPIPLGVMSAVAKAGGARAHRHCGDHRRESQGSSSSLSTWLTPWSFEGSQTGWNGWLRSSLILLNQAEDIEDAGTREGVLRAFSPRTIGILPFSKPKPQPLEPAEKSYRAWRCISSARRLVSRNLRTRGCQGGDDDVAVVGREGNEDERGTSCAWISRYPGAHPTVADVVGNSG